MSAGAQYQTYAKTCRKLEKEFPKIIAIEWPGSDEEGSDDEEDDSSKTKHNKDDEEERITSKAQVDIYGEINKGAPLPDKYSAGHCITKAGVEKFMNIIDECDNRDQDRFGMYIYNDWNGYGLTEVLENMVSIHFSHC
jgi:hypothetical protein